MREVLENSKIDARASNKMATFHAEALAQVKTAVAENDIVVVGMAHNPVVKKARGILEKQNVSYKYLEYGNYFSQWKLRLAIKLWSGWPTFPQIFIKGQLIGGCDDLIEWMKAHPLK